ncbi:MAG: DUF1549 domain-containing protein, partial [Pirellulaceae bacterium]|nr:DUF1549 domain-containing protein [Pirellulaceae bacterium]
MTTRLSINSAWICLCLANWLSPVRAADLIVLPEQVVVSADYPAQLVVLERLPDGSVIDRSHASDLKVTCDLTSGLRIALGGQVEVTPAAPAEGMSTTLNVSLGSMHRTVPVSVSSAGHQSPIFPREVSAVLGKTGCNLGTCHGNLHGKAGFRLSLRGDDAVLDYTAIVRGQAGRRIDRFAAKDSLLLRKPLGQLAHQGGTRFKVDSREARILEQWIAEGCQWNAATGAPVPSQSTTDRPDETLVSLQVMPERALLAKSCRTQQLLVLGKFADGVVRDVTGFARFEPSVVTGVEISPQGLVTAARPVDMSISVSYLSGRTASRLTFLAHDQYDWQQPAPESRLDELVEQQLRKLQIQPMPLADDYVFIRRAYLAIVGQLPTAEQVKAYAEAAESTEDKQARLVEHLLHQPGYALLWSLRWSDLLRNEQKVMSDKGAALWHAWMTEQIAADRPLGEFVSEMLTTLGSTYDHPAASFHRTHRDPETAAESIGQVFLGVRLQCARCHNHPFDKWRQDDYYGLSA